MGDNLSLTIEDQRDGQRLLYSPSLAGVDESDMAWLRDADCLLVDGSTWAEPEGPLRASEARRKVLMRMRSIRVKNRYMIWKVLIAYSYSLQ